MDLRRLTAGVESGDNEYLPAWSSRFLFPNVRRADQTVGDSPRAKNGQSTLFAWDSGVLKKPTSHRTRHFERSEKSAFERDRRFRKADSSSFLLGMTALRAFFNTPSVPVFATLDIIPRELNSPPDLSDSLEFERPYLKRLDLERELAVLGVL